MTEEIKEDIGAILKARREELGFSLSDAAQRTRIRKGFLESLENNRFKALPGQVYVTGFIRVYAGYLGLDSAPLLKMLAPETAKPQVAKSQPPVTKTKSEVDRPTKKTSSGTWRPFFIGFLAVLIIGGVIFFLLPAPRQETAPETAPVVEQPQASSESSIVQDHEPVHVEVAPSAQQQEPSVSAEVAEPVAEVHEEVVAPRPLLPAIKEDGSSLRMLALTDGSLIINVDNRKPHEYPLHEGLDLTWKIREKVSLELGGAEQALFWLDGKALDLGDALSIQLEQAP